VLAGPDEPNISGSTDNPGWILQESTSLTPANWLNSPGGSTNPIDAPATLPTKFYHLHKP